MDRLYISCVLLHVVMTRDGSLQGPHLVQFTQTSRISSARMCLTFYPTSFITRQLILKGTLALKGIFLRTCSVKM